MALYIRIMIFLLLTGCSNQQQTQAAGNAPEFSAIYKQRSASREGIGKVYLGREIARVMDSQNASWLDRSSRDVEEFPDRLATADVPLDRPRGPSNAIVEAVRTQNVRFGQ